MPAARHLVLPRVPVAIALTGALSILAWAALATWSAGPSARYLDHGRWTDLPLLGTLCSGLPQADQLTAVLFHALAWLLMIAAMMLPTALPLLRTVERVASSRHDAGIVVGMVVLGYASAWAAFGVLAYGIDVGVRDAAARSGWIAAHTALVGAAVLTVAGAFQFSALKYKCLDRCRTPFGFVTQRWSGRRPHRDALRIGIAHGIFCVGCCWALMLLMFVVGMGNLGWMLVLAVLMAAEKNTPAGRRLAAPIGIGLLGCAAAVAFGVL